VSYWPPVRAGVVLALLMLLAGSAAAGTISYWSSTTVLRRLDGARIQVGSRAMRIDSETTLCGGLGRSIRRNGERRWRRFDCTYTTFTRAGVGRDIEFRLDVVSATRFRLSDARWIVGP